MLVEQGTQSTHPIGSQIDASHSSLHTAHATLPWLCFWLRSPHLQKGQDEGQLAASWAAEACGKLGLFPAKRQRMVHQNRGSLRAGLCLFCSLLYPWA